MKCPKCSHINEDDALYCSKCGIKFEKKQDWNSILILAYCCSLLFWAITYTVLPIIFNWLDLPWQTTSIVYSVFGIISSLLTFVLPLGIRQTWMKIAAFVVVAIAAILNIIGNITTIITTINMNI